MGHIGRVPLTRELIIGVTPWIVVYRVRADAVEPIRGLHAPNHGRRAVISVCSGEPRVAVFDATREQS